MGDLGADEEHGGTVRAGGGAGTAADARGRVHGHVGDDFRDRDGIRVRRGARPLADEPAGLHDPVVGGPVDDEVALDREGIRSERLDRDDLAIPEFPHVELAGRAAARAVRDAVDRERAVAADAFAAVRVELDRLDAIFCQVLVDDVDHLEERGFGGNVICLVVFELARAVRALLTPDFQIEFHNG